MIPNAVSKFLKLIFLLLNESKVMILAKEGPEMMTCPAMDGLLRVHKVIIDELDMEENTSNDSTVMTRLLVAGMQFVSLIGKRGSLIRSIQETSRTTMRILNDSVIEICDSASGVHQALELVTSHLRKYLVDRLIIPLFQTLVPPHIEHNMWTPPQLPAQHQTNIWTTPKPPGQHQRFIGICQLSTRALYGPHHNHQLNTLTLPGPHVPPPLFQLITSVHHGLTTPHHPMNWVHRGPTAPRVNWVRGEKGGSACGCQSSVPIR